MSLKRLLAATAALLIATPAAAQSITGLTVKDGSAASQTLCTYTLTATQVGCNAPHVWNGSAWGPEGADAAFRPYTDIGGYYNTTPPTYSNGAPAYAQFNAHGGLQVGVSGSAIVSNGNSQAPVAFYDTGGTARPLWVAPSYFNGSSYDRQEKPNTASRIPSSAATTNATSAKASQADLFSVQAYNTTASAIFLKIYNKASAPTVGTDTPVKTLAIPANGSLTVGWAEGFYLSAGLAYALTGAAADSDTTSVAAGAVVGLNLDYQ